MVIASTLVIPTEGRNLLSAGSEVAARASRFVPASPFGMTRVRTESSISDDGRVVIVSTRVIPTEGRNLLSGGSGGAARAEQIPPGFAVRNDKRSVEADFEVRIRS
jgi:hypothetical protein